MNLGNTIQVSSAYNLFLKGRMESMPGEFNSQIIIFGLEEVYSTVISSENTMERKK